MRNLIVLHILMCITLAAPQCAAGGAKPNIVLILTDDLGYGDLGIHGSTEVATPSIDKIARSGIRFTNGYTTSSICAPSRSGLLTGRYQQTFGIDDNHLPLPLEQRTLAEYLKASGYATCLIGKWHQSGRGHQMESLNTRGFHPNDRGFDHFYGFYGWGTDYYRSSAIYRNKTAVKPRQYLTYDFAEEATAFIDRSALADHPFFLLLSFNAVHTPIQPAPDVVLDQNATADSLRSIHLSMVAALDRAVGIVMDKLRESGVEENTLVIFFNDNGGKKGTGSSNGGLRGGKYGIYEGGIKVPFIVQYPKYPSGGTTVTIPVSTLDIFKTCVDVAGMSAPVDMTGLNLLDLGTAGQATDPRPLYWMSEMSLHALRGHPFRQPTYEPMKDQWYAIRLGRWKLHQYDDGPRGISYELYDLQNDPGEKENVAGTHVEVVDELRSSLEVWKQSLPEKH